jgi:hypothetical protein
MRIRGADLGAQKPGLAQTFAPGTAGANGILNIERRLAQRSYFIIDKKGVIGYKKLIGSGQPLVPNDELVEEIKKISAS